MRLHICADLGGGGGKTLAPTLLSLVALIVVAALALKPTPAEAHPCADPLDDLGVIIGTTVRTGELHDGNCLTTVNGEGRWVATYTFELVERRIVTIDLENISDIDPYLRLLDESGTEITVDDDGGDGLNSQIRRTLERGVYKVEATKYNAEAGEYRLTISVEQNISVEQDGASTSNSATVRSLSVGGDHACALTDDNRIICWGRNDRGQLNVPSHVSPTTRGGLDLGSDYSCAWSSSGRRYGSSWQCWGSRTRPEIVVQRDHDDYWWPSSIGESLRCGPYSGYSEWRRSWYVYRYCGSGSGNSRSTSASLAIVGGSHRCSSSGSCWGDNTHGQLDVPEGIAFRSTDAGRNHTCAVAEGGSLHCWGDDRRGQSTPPAGQNWQAVYSNGFADFSCALTSEAKVVCWGANDFGQLDVPASFAADISDAKLPLSFEETAPRPTWERGRQIAVLELPASQGGSGEVTYRIASRCGDTFTLGPPDGLEFNAASRVLRGTLSGSVPEGSCALHLSATDSAGQTASLDITADVRMPADFRWLSSVESQEWMAEQPIEPLGLPAATSAAGGLTYSLRWAEVNWAGHRTTVHDGLPSGLQFDEPARTISGTPNESLRIDPGFTGSYELIYTATDASGISLDLAVPFSVIAPRGAGPLIRARIVARPLNDGRIELGLRVEGDDGARELILPQSRHISANADSGRWQNTAPINYRGAHVGDISTRRTQGGRTELSVLTTSGERVSPAKRFLPASAAIGRWQRSSQVLLSVDSVTDNGCAGAVVDLGALEGTTIHSGAWGAGDCVDNLSHVDGYVIAVDDRTEVTIQVSPASYVDRWSGPASAVELLDADGLAIPHDSVDAAEYGGRNGLIRATLEPGQHRLVATSGSSSATGRPRPWEGRYTLVVTTDGESEGEQSAIAARLTPAVARQIAETYAPVWKLDSDEAFRPVGIEAMLENSWLRRGQIGKDEEDLCDYRYDVEVLSRDVTVSDMLDNSTDDAYLDLFAGGQGTNEEQWSTVSDEYRSVVYSRVIAPQDDTIVVQYWTFWVYNNPEIPKWVEERPEKLRCIIFGRPDHEGDWEGIQLVFSGLTDEPVRSVLYGMKPTWLGYAAHSHGDTYDGFDDGGGPAIEEVEYRADVQGVARPVVYVAQGSHASYADALPNHVKLGENFDRANGKGRELTLAPSDHGSLGKYELRLINGDESWLTWVGTWGDTYAPRSPLVQDGWWSDPLCWDGWENDIQNRGTYTAELRGCD